MLSFADFLIELSWLDKAKEIYVFKDKTGKVHSVTLGDFLMCVHCIQSYLSELGLGKGAKVAIVANNSYLWIASDLSVMARGLVSVPMFPNAAVETLNHQIKQIQPQLIIVDKAGYEGLYNVEVDKNIPILYLDDKDPEITNDSVVFFEDIVDKFNENVKLSLDYFEKNDLATIVYTSGTSDTSKGVMISHYNLISQVQNSRKRFPLQVSDRALIFLPCAHIFQRMIAYLYLLSGVRTVIVDDVHNVRDYLVEFKPTIFITVPRLLEKIFANIKDKVKARTGIRGIIARMAFRYALTNHPEVLRKITHWMYKDLVFNKILAKLGGKIRIVVCGGAALSPKIYRFMVNIGLPLYQGYGLTEASPVIATNCPKSNKIFTVGKLFDGIEYKLEADGELLVKGDNVSLGYFQDEEATQAVFADGWLRTGDLAEVDKNGFLTILGRKKEQFKTSTGKYVNPIIIESRLNAVHGVEIACVIADGKKFVSALIFPSKEFIGKTSVLDEILFEALGRINKRLDPHERIIKITVIDEEISIDKGQITPSAKLRRGFIYKKYEQEIEKMYE